MSLFVLTSDGTTKTLPLIPRSVAAFYREFMACLQALGIEVTINTLPSEIRNPIRCDEDEVHASYSLELSEFLLRYEDVQQASTPIISTMRMRSGIKEPILNHVSVFSILTGYCLFGNHGSNLLRLVCVYIV